MPPLAYWGVSTGSHTTVQPDTRRRLPLSSRVLAGLVVVAAAVVIAVLALGGGGHTEAAHTAGLGVVTRSHTAGGGTTHLLHTGATAGGESHRANQAGAAAGTRHAETQSATAGTRANAGATSVGHANTGATGAASVDKAAAVAEVRDPEESKSFPLPASVRHRAASTPSVAGEAAVAPGAASDAEIRKELGEEEHAKAEERAAQNRVLTPVAGGFSVGGNGTIPIPTNVPETVQRVIAGGNAIADFPYIWGGGHASFVANGYDCSGSVSYALAAGGLLSAPLVSGDLATWGEPGPGRWITIYANAGHTFMDVDGVWFDTAGRSGPYASRWLVSQPTLEGYAVRHPQGL
jgi:cell wall-associated NlpC family hydrolase